MKDEGDLTLAPRRQVYQAIVRHPGIHLRELERRTGISLGDLRYHLEYLESHGLVNSLSDGYRRGFFPSRGFFLQDRRALALLRQGVPRAIVGILLQRGTADYEGLASALGLSKPTLSFHLRKLVAGGVLGVERSGGRNHYHLVDRERTLRLLITYREGLLDAAVDRFASLWLPYLEAQAEREGSP